MVHTFEADGTYYLFDNAVGALHICDRLTAEVVKKINGEKYDLSAVDEETVREIEAEIEELKREGVLFAEEEKEIPLKSDLVKALCLHICHDCNLRCEYCFAGQGNYKGRTEYMSFGVAKAAVDFLISNSGNRKILEMDFFGGEPLMNLSVVKKTVDYAKEQGKKHNKKFLFTLTTNGVLLNEETAKYLNEEMENVVLSIDGRREVHDGVRKTVNGKGSYDVIIENIKNFVKMRGDKHYYVRGTFTKKNLDFANDVLYLADEGLTEISLEPVVTDENSPLYIGEKDVPAVAEEYRRLAREYKRRYAAGERLFNFFHFQIDLTGGPCLKKRVSACGAGNEYVAVTPSGDIYPCHQFAGNPETRMGSVLDGTFDIQAQKKYKECNVLNKEECSRCWAKYYCSGGCAANAYIYNEDINKPYKMACLLEKKRLECALAIYALKYLKEGAVQ